MKILHFCWTTLGNKMTYWKKLPSRLTHWGRVTHICVSKLISIGSDNGLSPGRRQAIIWTNAGLLLIGSLGTNFNEILIEILTVSFMKMRLKVSSAKRWPFCLGLNVLRVNSLTIVMHMCQWIGSSCIRVMACRLFRFQTMTWINSQEQPP